jgi:hypothetical protein
MARIDHLTGGIHRISTYAPEKRISFNQFLIDDNEPALIQLFTKWMTAFDDLSLRSPLPVRAFRPRPLLVCFVECRQARDQRPRWAGCFWAASAGEGFLPGRERLAAGPIAPASYGRSGSRFSLKQQKLRQKDIR